MRLTELTGYKSHPINKAGTQLKAANKFDKIFSAYDPGSMENLKNILGQHGWEEAGLGYYAMVFTHPNYPYVVKVFVNDTAYAEYFNVMKHMQSNPHVPKIRGNFIRVGKEGYAVRLEKLTPITSRRDPIFKKYIDPTLPFRMDSIITEDNEPFLASNWPELNALITEIKYIGGATFDWYPRNVMARGSVLVVTDPLALP